VQAEVERGERGKAGHCWGFGVTQRRGTGTARTLNDPHRVVRLLSRSSRQTQVQQQQPRPPVIWSLNVNSRPHAAQFPPRLGREGGRDAPTEAPLREMWFFGGKPSSYSFTLVYHSSLGGDASSMKYRVLHRPTILLRFCLCSTPFPASGSVLTVRVSVREQKESLGVMVERPLLSGSRERDRSLAQRSLAMMRNTGPAARPASPRTRASRAACGFASALGHPPTLPRRGREGREGESEPH
jgi:hypothetical protein